MYAYELKFISYNKEKTQKTTVMKVLVIASSPTKAKKEIEKCMKEANGWLVDFMGIKNLGYKGILVAK